MPRVIGQTAKAVDIKRGGSVRSKKDEITFFKALEKRSSALDVEVARSILSWAKERFSEVTWGSATFTTVLDYGSSHTFNPLLVFTSGKPGLNGTVRVRLPRMLARNPPFNLDEKRLELLRRLNEIPGVDAPDDFTKAVIIPLKVLVDTQALAKFQRAIEWTIAEVKASQEEKH